MIEEIIKRFMERYGELFNDHTNYFKDDYGGYTNDLIEETLTQELTILQEKTRDQTAGEIVKFLRLTGCSDVYISEIEGTFALKYLSKNTKENEHGK